MADKFLTAAARAHALICRSDGRLVWPETHGLASAVRNDPAFSAYSAEEIEDAAAKAFISVMGDESFDDIALEIASRIKAPEERAAIIRVARAALVADAVRREQEDDAIRALALALGLDPDKA
jgi:tellurite resistance protein